MSGDLTSAQERFLAHFDGVKREGGQWKARCPGHDDHCASLSIRFDGEKVLVHDFAGCGAEYLLGRVGLKMADLFFDSPANGNGHGNHARQARIVATYPYVDERGVLLFEVLRFDPKNFKQRKPDGNGGWIPKLGNVRRVPYRLPEVLAANDVVVPEGERDCDNARTLAFVATCNPGGAGKWREEFSEVLRGKNIVIIQDADEPGRKHAQQVARSLWLRAASIKVLEPPGAKDLTAWIERGGTREMLLEIIRNAPEWKPPDEISTKMDTPSPERNRWPEPLAPEAFHGIAGEFILAVAPQTEADPAALLIQFLVAAGSAIGRGPCFTVEQHRHHVNLFSVIVGETSKARKGSSWQQVIALLTAVNPDWAENRIHGGVGSGEGIIWNLRDPILKGNELVDEGVQDKRLLLLETEFAQVLAVIERQGATVSEILRRAWDGTTLQTLVKNNPARATGAHVSMLGHITNSELTRHLSETEIANGLANRFIFCCARRSNVLPDGGALDWKDYPQLVEKLRNTIVFARSVGEMKRDSGARTLWHQVYRGLSDGKPGLLGCVISRGEAQVLRLSMLYALLDCSAVIRREHLAAALAVWNYAEASCRYIFGDALGDPVADEILRALRRAEKGLTRSEIHGLFGRNRQEPEISRALGTLAKHGLAHFVTEPTRGRPAERWVARIRRYEIDEKDEVSDQAP